MDYAAAREVFLTPVDVPPPPVVTAGSPGRRLRDALEPIATQPIWSPDAQGLYAGLGLDFLSGYVGERAAALGPGAPPAVVVSAFGVFAPDLLLPLLERSRAVSFDALVHARARGSAETVRRVLGAAVPESAVDGAVGVLRRGLAAADGLARPLFAGLSERRWPADPFGGLVHAADLLREHRGDGHLAVCAAAGLDAVEATVLTELHTGYPLLGYAPSRGWGDQQLGAAVDRLRGRGLLAGDGLSDDGRRLRAEIEARTDATQAGVLAAIGPDLDRVTGQLTGWGDALVAAGVAPGDARKRAAG